MHIPQSVFALACCTATLLTWRACSVALQGWYDKIKILLKDIMNSQYVACMNPTAGSFNITPRMQRHFVTFAVQMPGADIVRSIYFQIVDGHLQQGFDNDVVKLSAKLVDASIELHRTVMNNFLPSAVKFHYQFNLREMANIVQGICRMRKEIFRDGPKTVRLWVHECDRVFRDRMVNDSDIARYDDFRTGIAKKYFEGDGGGMNAIMAQPNIYTSFMTFSNDDEPVRLGLMLTCLIRQLYYVFVCDSWVLA